MPLKEKTILVLGGVSQDVEGDLGANGYIPDPTTPDGSTGDSTLMYVGVLVAIVAVGIVLVCILKLKRLMSELCCCHNCHKTPRGQGTSHQADDNSEEIHYEQCHHTDLNEGWSA